MMDFTSDYNQGAHPKILQRLVETNFEKVTSYGLDKYSLGAMEKIKNACGRENAQVYFLTGGTQTNQTVIMSVLKGYEGVIAADTGHIGSHEAGAIEFTGHKVLPIPHENGKLTALSVKKYVEKYYADENYEHMVFPGMVYISHPTEYGTIYSKSELEALYAVCREYKMTLYIDGARLGYGLVCGESDMSLRDIAALCDVFYIGGTKVGALCGEAVVFTHGNMPEHFMTLVKRNGAMIAKGRLIGLQFDTLFADGLYFDISRSAIEKADRLKGIFREKEYRFYIDSPTNQIFILLEDEKLKLLQQQVKVSFWEKPDDAHTVVRFATSWATTDDEIDALEKIL